MLYGLNTQKDLLEIFCSFGPYLATMEIRKEKGKDGEQLPFMYGNVPRTVLIDDFCPQGFVSIVKQHDHTRTGVRKGRGHIQKHWPDFCLSSHICIVVQSI